MGTRGKGGLTSGGNMIIHGVKGVSKTTLIKGVEGVLRHLSTSVYTDYQLDGFARPLDLLRSETIASNILSYCRLLRGRGADAVRGGRGGGCT